MIVYAQALEPLYEALANWLLDFFQCYGVYKSAATLTKLLQPPFLQSDKEFYRQRRYVETFGE